MRKALAVLWAAAIVLFLVQPNAGIIMMLTLLGYPAAKFLLWACRDERHRYQRHLATAETTPNVIRLECSGCGITEWDAIAYTQEGLRYRRLKLVGNGKAVRLLCKVCDERAWRWHAV